MAASETAEGAQSDRERGIMLKVLEDELHAIQHKLGAALSRKSTKVYCKTAYTSNVDACPAINEIMLLFIELQLRTYYFFERSSSHLRTQGLLKAYDLALSLISKVLDLDREIHSLRYAPAVFYHAILVSALFLLRTVKSNFAAYVDLEQAERLFRAALSKLRDCALEDDDFRCRARKILAELWTIDRSSRMDPDKEPSLKLKTRLGGSILHDSLWTWREEFRGQRSRTASPTRTDQARGRQPVMPRAAETLEACHAPFNDVQSDNLHLQVREFSRERAVLQPDGSSSVGQGAFTFNDGVVSGFDEDLFSCLPRRNGPESAMAPSYETDWDWLWSLNGPALCQ